MLPTATRKKSLIPIKKAAHLSRENKKEGERNPLSTPQGPTSSTYYPTLKKRKSKGTCSPSEKARFFEDIREERGGEVALLARREGEGGQNRLKKKTTAVLDPTALKKKRAKKPSSFEDQRRKKNH